MKDPKSNKFLDKPAEKANLFNRHFASVFTKDTDTSTPQEPEENDSATRSDRNLLTITQSTVTQKLKELDPNKSPGPDQLHPRMMKELAVVISGPLTYIYQQSIRTSTIPSLWKKAVVIPIYKKGDRQDPANYRPISLTSIACKILESIVANHILQFLNNENKISEQQFGFLKKRSAELQLLLAVEEWRENLDKGLQTDLIYLDLKKAFDKVPHRILIKKLEDMGLDELQGVVAWIKSFLQNRTQVVAVDGETGDLEVEVASGVPQGSVLGPLLFNLYINDLADGIDSGMLLFADDTKLYRVIETTQDHQTLQNDLHKIKLWMDKHKMEVNVEKSHHVTIGFRSKSTSYKLGDQNIQLSQEERDLGIIVDSELSFSAHYEGVIRKAQTVAGIIRRSFELKDHRVLATLLKSLVRPILEYGHCSVRPFYNKDLDALERIQRRMTKFCPALKNVTYEERLKTLKVPTLAYRLHRGDLIEAYKICNGAYDSRLAGDLVTLNPNNLRGHDFKLSSKRFKKDVGRWKFGNRIVETWNQLPSHVVASPSVDAFKKALDDHVGNDKYCVENFRRVL